jgi:hypothetical protein
MKRQACSRSLPTQADFFRQLHEKPLASFPTPPIAVNAADQPLAVMIDFDDWAIAFGARASLISVRAHGTHSLC